MHNSYSTLWNILLLCYKWIFNVLWMCFCVTIDGDISSSWCTDKLVGYEYHRRNCETGKVNWIHVIYKYSELGMCYADIDVCMFVCLCVRFSFGDVWTSVMWDVYYIYRERKKSRTIRNKNLIQETNAVKSAGQQNKKKCINTILGFCVCVSYSPDFRYKLDCLCIESNKNRLNRMYEYRRNKNRNCVESQTQRYSCEQTKNIRIQSLWLQH